MPKYLFTSDLRISMLSEKIQKTASFVVEGGRIADISDKSENNNATTLAYYFNLYENTQTCNIAAYSPLEVIRNFVLKFQFPNTRTRDSYNDSLSEKTLFAPYRSVVRVLFRMSERDAFGVGEISLDEILYYLFCDKNVYTTPNFDVDKVIDNIHQGRKNNHDIEGGIKRTISWNQYGRQVREMMTVLTKAFSCFKLSKNTLVFSKNDPNYIDNKEIIEGLLSYHFMWYPSNKDSFYKAEKEYISYMDMKESSYSVIDYHNEKTKEFIETEITLESPYRTYITAIKSKPFLLLAGISGTGKSRIVRELARACWDSNSDEYKAQKPRNFEMVQVKPNWHDSSELIGYVSRIDGVRYVVGPFLKFMVKATQDLETPYFLCLDEMNLAPVEQYFAEYLSVIESRKRQEDGTITTDPIIDYSNTDEYYSLICQLFPGDENAKAEYLTEEGGKRLSIPQNLIVVGTVNMDETTFSFSRKVLDRAMTIEMNEVNLRGGLVDRNEKIGKLGKNELVGTYVEGVDVYSTYKEVCRTAIKYLESINEKLEGTPFKIAYRTRNETLLYVVNNLPYNKDKDGNALDENYVIARALDEITNMKILSRIEGDTTKIDNLLEQLTSTIAEQLKEVSGEEFSSKRDEPNKYYSVSLAKLEEMKRRLDGGFTSFWS